MKFMRAQQGVSLIELLVAMGILAVALVPLLSLFTQSLRTAERSNKRTIAIHLARDLQEEIRARAFWEPDEGDIPALSSDTAYFPNGTTAQPFGLEEGTFGSTDTRWSKFDDIDDYNHWCRGKDCTECPTTPTYDGRCQNDTPLEAYDGTEYKGAGYPRYENFTRMVEIYNIYPNLSTEVSAGENRRGDEPRQHTMNIGGDDKVFDFYDLQDDTLTTLKALGGKTRVKVIKVTVTYTGPLTAALGVEDTGIAILPIREE